jgi:hypothetical protein
VAGIDEAFGSYVQDVESEYPLDKILPPSYDECPDRDVAALVVEGEAAAAGCLTFAEYQVLSFQVEYGLKQGDADELLRRIKDPRFNPQDINAASTRTLQDRARKANDVEYQEFNFWRPGDGAQTLDMWLRDIEAIVRQILEDKEYDGYMYWGFEKLTDEQGRRIFGPVNSGLFFQINCNRVGANNTMIALAIFIDGSFLKMNIFMKPALGMYV